jgi:hypothetical protein
MIRKVLHSAVIAIVVNACSASTESAEGKDWFESCEGHAHCVGDAFSFDAELWYDGQTCVINSDRLYPSGSGPGYTGMNVTWQRTARGLDYCVQDYHCFECEILKPGATPSASAEGGRCTGSATSCASVSASTCTDQRGCRYEIGVNVSSTSDDRCSGTARECDDLDFEACEGQRGCTWK